MSVIGITFDIMPVLSNDTWHFVITFTVCNPKPKISVLTKLWVTQFWFGMSLKQNERTTINPELCWASDAEWITMIFKYSKTIVTLILTHSLCFIHSKILVPYLKVIRGIHGIMLFLLTFYIILKLTLYARYVSTVVFHLFSWMCYLWFLYTMHYNIWKSLCKRYC